MDAARDFVEIFTFVYRIKKLANNTTTKKREKRRKVEFFVYIIGEFQMTKFKCQIKLK